MARCIVSFLDHSGFRHSVEVEAESLFEAAVLAIRAFRLNDCEPGAMSQLDVEIVSSVTHHVTPRRIQEWLNNGARSPKEAATKERLKALL